MKHFSVVFSLVLLFFSGSKAQVYQLSNQGFEIWDGTSASDEPTNWNGFPSASCNLVVGCGSAMATRHEKSTDKRPGSSGSYSCKIFATEISILGNTIIANGNITTGQIRIGSTSASSNQNYNITRTSNSNFMQPLNAKPDSISFWVKFVCPSSIQQARMSATIHDSYDYRDPESSDANAPNHVVAKAIYNFSRGNQGWNKFTIPFDYNFPASTPSYILLIFTTNKIAGEGSASDVLYIDDIELIYNPRLASLQVNGIPVLGFHPDVTDYYFDVSCFSSQNVSATPASANAFLQITQPSYLSPVSIVVVDAGNVTRQYNIHFSYVSIVEYSAQMCLGDAYSDNWFDLPVQNNSGIFLHETCIFSSPGCDSIMKLNLTVHPSYYPDTLNVMICENGNYDFYGNMLTDEGIYDTLFHTQSGCDSLVVLNLEVGDHYLFTIFASICEGETYSQHGFNQSVTGFDTLTYLAQDGCDSLIVLNLTVNPVFSVVLYDTISQGHPYQLLGFMLPPQNTPGIFTFQQNLLSVSGCDSIVTLNLTVTEVVEEPLEEDPEFGVNVYPNPAFDEITIELLTNSTGLFTYELYDSYSQLKKSGIISDKSANIFVNELSSGAYLIRVTSCLGRCKIVKLVLF